MTAPVASDRLDCRASQAVFRILLDTLARPGQLRRLPIGSIGPGIVALALGGVDTSFAVVGDERWQERIRLATGAGVVPLDEAPLVGLYGRTTPGTLARLRRGSALVPEGGAKVGLACRRLHQGPGEVTVRLSGPGVAGPGVVGFDGLDPELFTALAEVNRGFPAGVDVWFVDEADAVVGMPRSVHQELICHQEGI